MRLTSDLHLAWRGLSRARIRTFLMMAGVVVGISSLTILDAVGAGTKRETMKRFQNMLGTFDTVIIRPGSPRTRGMVSLTTVPPTLTFDDAGAIATEIPEITQVAQVQNAFDIDVKYRDRTDSPAVFGVSANWPHLRGDRVADGRFVTDEDVRVLSRVAVLGADVVPLLFPRERPVGLTIRIGDIPFQIVGVLAARGAGPGGGSLDHLIMIPVSTASKRMFNRDFLTMAIAQLRQPDQSDVAIQRIGTLLRRRHHIAPTALDDFSITSPQAVMARVTEMGSTLTTILRGVAAIAMLTAGVVITALMLMGVSERRTEIGVRRSVGASRQDIWRQFLVEALLITSVGGLVGISLGLAGTTSVAALQRVPSVLAWDAVARAAVLSAGLGLIFGLYPAWRAAHVDPVEALRL